MEDNKWLLTDEEMKTAEGEYNRTCSSGDFIRLMRGHYEDMSPIINRAGLRKWALRLGGSFTHLRPGKETNKTASEGDKWQPEESELILPLRVWREICGEAGLE